MAGLEIWKSGSIGPVQFPAFRSVSKLSVCRATYSTSTFCRKKSKTEKKGARGKRRLRVPGVKDGGFASRFHCAYWPHSSEANGPMRASCRPPIGQSSHSYARISQTTVYLDTWPWVPPANYLSAAVCQVLTGRYPGSLMPSCISIKLYCQSTPTVKPQAGLT